MNYKIISAQEADWKKFKDLRLEALQTDQVAFGASYKDEVLKSDERWKEGLARTEKPLFFIEADNKYIGMIGAKPVENGIYMIIAMYVLKEYRGQGLAQQLIKIIEIELKNRGIKELDLIVNKTQAEAVNLYKKLGYRLIRETEEKMGDGGIYPCLFMSKNLT